MFFCEIPMDQFIKGTERKVFRRQIGENPKPGGHGKTTGVLKLNPPLQTFGEFLAKIKPPEKNLGNFWQKPPEAKFLENQLPKDRFYSGKSSILLNLNSEILAKINRQNEI